MITKVYRYGLRPPRENADLVRSQMRLAHAYRNRLVEIARAERAERRALEQSHGSIPVLEAAAKAAAAACEAAYAAIKQGKAADRTRSVPEPLRAAHLAAKDTKRAAAHALYAARAALKSDLTVVDGLDQIGMKYAELRRAARAACGCYWGTYLPIESADQQARKMPLWDGTEPNDPRFQRWEGEGSVAVQIQGGLDVAQITKSLHVRIEDRAPPPGVDPKSKRSAKRRYADLALRVDTGDKREPIWARWPMVMHRPLPEDGVIKWVTVKVRKIGPREEWYALFTVQSDEGTGRSTAEPGNRVAVDIGWRVREDGIRVAAWRSDSGERGFLVLDEDLLSQISKADSLRAIRDRNFDAAKAALSAALPGLSLPGWFPANIWQWKSAGRLAALAKRWKNERFDGDAVAYAALEAWRYHDHHLWEWETSQRTKSLRHRREIYRVFAAQTARRFSGLVLEKFDLRKVAMRPSAEKQEGDNEQARSNRQRAATSELRECLKQAFSGSVTEVPAEYTTRTCAACSSIETWDQAKEVEHTCASCGSHWDQDDNATRNLLAYRERPGDDGNAGVARGDEKPSNVGTMSETRWQKARRMSIEKRARMEVARNKASEAAE